jgi:hypothetical protein
VTDAVEWRSCRLGKTTQAKIGIYLFQPVVVVAIVYHPGTRDLEMPRHWATTRKQDGPPASSAAAWFASPICPWRQTVPGLRSPAKGGMIIARGKAAAAAAPGRDPLHPISFVPSGLARLKRAKPEGTKEEIRSQKHGVIKSMGSEPLMLTTLPLILTFLSPGPGCTTTDGSEVESRNEDDLRRHRKSHASKVCIAARLRRKTIMTLDWIAEQLSMGSWVRLGT